jgi:hypothetical protein
MILKNDLTISGYGEFERSIKSSSGCFKKWLKIVFEIKEAKIRLHSILLQLRKAWKSKSELKRYFGIWWNNSDDKKKDWVWPVDKTFSQIIKRLEFSNILDK